MIKKEAISIRLFVITLILSLGSTLHAQEPALEEIIVTAQKRTQSLQDVPISVATVSGDTIGDRSIDSLSSLSNSIPNLYITESQIDSRIQIRGILTGANKGFEQSVAMYSDGIYYGRSQLVRLPLVDLDRVEVLRGPQPTLFGKNAIAGAVSVHSARPTDEFEGSLSLSYEVVHEEPQANVVLSGPLSDAVRGRAVISYRGLDGYFNNQFLNRKEPNIKELFFRGTLEWDVADNFLARLKVEFADFEREGWPLEIHTPIGTFSDVYGSFMVEFNQDYHNESSRTNSINDVKDFVLDLEYQLGGHTLSGTTGYVDYDTTEIVDVDYSRLNILDGTNQAESYKQFSQELRLTSPGGEKVDYIAGLYYQDGDLTATDEVFLGPFLAANPALVPIVDSFTDRLYTQSATLWSVFAQVDVHFTDVLTLTVGARYNQEDKEGRRRFEIISGPTNTGADIPSPSPDHPNLRNFLYANLFNMFPHDVNGSRREKSFNPLVNLQYQIVDNVMTYVSFTQGTKAGGFDIRGNSVAGNPVPTAGTFEFEDEAATSYELGAKLFFPRAEFNFAVYYTEYKDLQTQIFDGSLGFLVTNAAAATTKGFEADGRALLSDNITIYGAVAFLDFKYDSFENGQCYFGKTPDNPDTGQCSLTGERAISTPEWTGSLGFDFDYRLTDTLDLDANLNLSYSDSYFNMANLDPNSLQSSYAKLGIVIGVSSADGKWRLSLIGDNLTDEVIFLTTGALPLSTTFTQQGGIAYDGFIARPRNFTFKFDYNF